MPNGVVRDHCFHRCPEIPDVMLAATHKQLIACSGEFVSAEEGDALLLARCRAASAEIAESLLVTATCESAGKVESDSSCEARAVTLTDALLRALRECQPIAPPAALCTLTLNAIRSVPVASQRNRLQRFFDANCT